MILNNLNCLTKRHDDLTTHTSVTMDCKDAITQEACVTKFNSNNWLINEFVANKVARLILGPDLVKEVRLEQDQQNHSQKFLVKELFPLPHFIEFNLFTPHDLPFSFKYITGGYNIKISHGKAVKIIKNKHHFTTVNGKQVKGFLPAYLLSILLDDNDLDRGNNFVLIEDTTSYHVTRIDFDDAFKFFDRAHIAEWKITQPTETARRFIYNGYGVETFNQLIKDGISRYSSSYSMLASDNIVPYSSLDKSKLAKSIKKFVKKTEDLASTIDTAYDEVGKVFSESELTQTYNETMLNCQTQAADLFSPLEALMKRDIASFCHVDLSTNILDKLKEFTKSMLSRRVEDLKQINICLQIELSEDLNHALAILEENNVSLNEEKLFLTEIGERLYCLYKHNLTPLSLTNLYDHMGVNGLFDHLADF